MLQCTPKRSVFCQPYFFAFFIFLFYEYQRIYCFFLFCVYGHFGFSLPHLLLLGFVFLFSAVRKKTWKTMRWYYCSCSFLSHQYLSFTVGAQTHKQNPSSAKDAIFNMTSLHLPTHLRRFFLFVFCHFASCVLCLAEKVDAHTKAAILMSTGAFSLLLQCFLSCMLFVSQRSSKNTLKL